MAIIVPIVSSWNPKGLDRAIADIKRAEGAFNTFTAVAAGIGGVMASTGRAMTYGLTLPLAAVGASALKTSAEFEQTMAAVRVNAGASGEQMKELSRLAMQMGADTVFSAGESAQAILELSKGGLSIATIQGGALASAMNLAATESIDLATASTIVVQTMNAFGFSAAETNKAVDILAAGAVASTADVIGLSEGLAYVGTTAAQLKVSMADTVTALASLSNAGIDASTSGTSLNRFLLGLTLNTPKAAKTAKALGLEFFDAAGQMKPMEDIIGSLAEATRGLGDDQRTQALKALFGIEGMRAANVLISEGVEGYKELSTQVNRNGVAAELSDARMSGLAGALEQMRGSIETAQLSIGTALTPTIMALSVAIKNLFDAFTNLDPELQTTIATVGLFLAAAGPVLWIVGSLVKAIGTMAIAIKALGTALTFLMANPVGLAIVTFALLAYAIYKVIQNWHLIKEAAGNAIDFIKEKMSSLWEWTKNIFGNIGNAFVEVGHEIVDGLKQGISNAWSSFKSWFISMIGQPIQWAKQILRIASPSKVFEGIGENVIKGYIKGVEDMTGTLQSTMAGMAVDSTVAFTGQVNSSGSTSTGGIGGGGAVYNINVNAGIGTDGAQVGREIVDAIRRFERASGPVFASA
jgi:TP901 family phage tail tape measure protein